MIDLRLAQPVPETLKKKLRLEKEIMKQLEYEDHRMTFEHISCTREVLEAIKVE